MTIKRCIRRNLLNRTSLCNVAFYIVFFTIFVLLHKFTNLKPQDVLPLFFFPFFHFMLLGIMLYLQMGKRCAKRQSVLLFVTFVLYATIAAWGFNSSGMRSMESVRQDFRDEHQIPNAIIWERDNSTIAEEFNTTLTEEEASGGHLNVTGVNETASGKE